MGVENGKSMGWWTVCLLFLMVSSQVWALDFDRSIERQESDSAQILQGLGRDRVGGTTSSPETRKLVQVQLIRKAKVVRKAKSNRRSVR